MTKSMAEDVALVNILEKPRFNEDPQYYLPGHNLFFFIFAEKAPPDLDIIVKEKVAHRLTNGDTDLWSSRTCGS